ncbi:hypothetical protein OG242_20825 [Streptomyces sp. NBC_00727]|uniref:hypothetical protein n=1 Tax=Streptomyces sp. NBC_00727 TaxID=2903675 RepID=UPI00386E8BA7
MVAKAEREVRDAERALATMRNPVANQDASQSGGRGTPDAGEQDLGTQDETEEDAAEAVEGSAPTSGDIEGAQQDLADARTRLHRAREANGPMLPASEVVVLQGFPARVDSVGVQLGSDASGKLMTLSAGALMIRSSLTPTDRGLVRPGQKVRILSELTGMTAQGTVRSVSDTLARAAKGQAPEDPGMAAGSAAGFTMTVKPQDGLSSTYVGQEVRLTVEAATSGQKVLVVPVSAISAGSDGRTTVTVTTPGHRDARRRVEVQVGAGGDGCVEVKPVAGELLEGDKVIVGSQDTSGGDRRDRK